MATPVPPLSVPQPRQRFGRGGEGTLRERLEGIAFALPALTVLTLFVIYPAYYTVRLAFYKSDFLFSFTNYVGLQNFKDLFQDKNFFDASHFPPDGAFFNNVKWVVVYSPNPDIGTFNAITHLFGANPIPLLGKPNTVNYAIIVAYVWASTGFAMVVLSAALKGIPTEIIEAARVDGAGEWNIFRRIMLPMLSLPISVVTVWLIINVMTSGGPGTSSRVIAYSMFTETFSGNPGRGAAVAVIMLLLMIPVMMLNIKRFRSERVMT